jgi:hypothetical protein
MKTLFHFLLIITSNLIVAQGNLPDLIPYQENGKWGYCDKNMKVLIPCQYDQAWPFYEDRALVINYGTNTPGTEAAFIDPSGRTVFKLNNWSTAFPSTRFQYGVAIIENYNKGDNTEISSLSVVDKNGKILQNYDSCNFESDMYFNPYCPPFNKFGFYVAPYGMNKQIWIYKDGREPKFTEYSFIFGFKFDNNTDFGFAFTYSGDTAVSYYVTVIDTNNQVLIPKGKLDFDPGFMPNHGSLSDIIPFKEKEKYGFCDLKGEIIIPAKFDFVQPFSEDLAVAGRLIFSDPYRGIFNYKLGYINKKGEFVIPEKFDMAYDFSEGLAEVRLGDSILFIDKSGNKKFSFFNKVPVVADAYGEYMINPPNIYNHRFTNGKAIMMQNELFGWIDKKGNFTVPPFFGGIPTMGPTIQINHFENGLTKVTDYGAASSGEFYIDESGRPYYLPQMKVLSKADKFNIYSGPSKMMLKEVMERTYIPTVKKMTGKKDKINGQKGEWIELESYDSSSYVFSSDFNLNAFRISDLKGAKLYDSPDENSKNVKLLAPNTIVFADEKEKLSKIGSNDWLKVIYVGYNAEAESAYKSYEGYVKGNQLVKILYK